MSSAKLPPWVTPLASPKRPPAGLVVTRSSRKQRSFIVDLAIQHGLADDGGAIQMEDTSKLWVRLCENVAHPGSDLPTATKGRSIDGWAAKLTGLQASLVIDVLKAW